jgi:hypothetical protein
LSPTPFSTQGIPEHPDHHGCAGITDCSEATINRYSTATKTRNKKPRLAGLGGVFAAKKIND